MTNINREIFKCLVLAQAASDSGKGIKYLYQEIPEFPGISKAYDKGYAYKDLMILKAIDLINKSRKSLVHFYVTRDPEISSYLVYFDIKGEFGRFQISFHCFNEKIYKYWNPSNKNSQCRWDNGNSRDTARLLAYLVLSEKI